MLTLVLACARPAPVPGAVAPAEVGPNAVGMTRRAFVDPDRLRWDGTGPRPLPVVVWYPTSDGSAAEDIVIGPPDRPLFRVGRAAPDAPLPAGELPTVLLSHGTGGERDVPRGHGPRRGAARARGLALHVPVGVR